MTPDTPTPPPDNPPIPAATDSSTTNIAVSYRALFSPRQAPRIALQGWLASRLVLVIVLLVLVWSNRWSVEQALTRWDVVHFIEVSQHGYTTLTQTAFFPGLPLLMAGFSLIGIPPVVSGVIISLIGSGMAAWALYRLAGGSVNGAVAVWAWSFAPMAVFTFVPYTEAIFSAFAFWSFWYAKRGRWGWAAGLASAACLFRVSGLFLIGALGLVALFGTRGATWRRRASAAMWMVIPALVIAAYVVYLRVSFGSWTTWFRAEDLGWARHFDWPWNAVNQTLHTAGIIGQSHYSTAVMFQWEIAAFVIGLALAIWLFVRKKIPEGGWVSVQVIALSCQVWLISVARTILLWFPLFTTIGDIGSGQLPRWKNNLRRGVLLAGLGLEVIALTWWASRFFCGAWAG
ncbi:MAG: hypothetical protein FWF25_04390 [Propionibacteriaceae bacterium]|nr:hypothetical protein [Propionibacteriaceae bacterium]